MVISAEETTSLLKQTLENEIGLAFETQGLWKWLLAKLHIIQDAVQKEGEKKKKKAAIHR